MGGKISLEDLQDAAAVLCPQNDEGQVHSRDPFSYPSKIHSHITSYL
jgi:hypothetical protein